MIFTKKTLTIKHTVAEVTSSGKNTVVEKDRTKTKSSYRNLPLVEPFEELLKRMISDQQRNRMVCGNAYCKKYLKGRFGQYDYRRISFLIGGISKK